MKKLKYVKENLKKWNWEVFGDNRMKKKNILQELDLPDRRESEGSLKEE